MTEDRRSGLDSGGCLNPACHAGGMTDTLSVDDDVVLFAAFPVVDDIVDELLLVVIVLFRKKNILRAVGDTAPESDITGRYVPLPR